VILAHAFHLWEYRINNYIWTVVSLIYWNWGKKKCCQRIFMIGKETEVVLQSTTLRICDKLVIFLLRQKIPWIFRRLLFSEALGVNMWWKNQTRLIYGYRCNWSRMNFRWLMYFIWILTNLFHPRFLRIDVLTYLMNKCFNLYSITLHDSHSYYY
jgi:hypothetical protein